MSINLNKGGRVNLSKEVPSLQKVVIGLGWDVSQYQGQAYDLDTSAFMLNEKGKIPSEEFFIFYNNLKSPDGSLVHQGDNRTGKGEGDDENLTVELAATRSDILEIVFVVSIHDAERRKQNFGQVRNAYIRLYDFDTKKEIAKYELDEDFSTEDAVEFGRMYKKDGDWRFAAVGQGISYGLQGLVDKYV